jgi:hypothetical protein
MVEAIGGEVQSSHIEHRISVAIVNDVILLTLHQYLAQGLSAYRGRRMVKRYHDGIVVTMLWHPPVCSVVMFALPYQLKYIHGAILTFFGVWQYGNSSRHSCHH